MAQHKLIAAVCAVALTSVFAAFAWADDEADRQAALAREPAPAPGPAFPGIREIQMIEACANGAQRYYPPEALNRRQSGDVVLDCVVDGDRLRSCQVLHDEPSRYGFGDAAIRVSCHVRITQSPEGEPLSNGPRGTRVYRREGEGEPWRARIPVRFRLG